MSVSFVLFVLLVVLLDVDVDEIVAEVGGVEVEVLVVVFCMTHDIHFRVCAGNFNCLPENPDAGIYR